MSNNIKTPKFVVSYPKVFKAELNELSGKMEYSVVALFKKGEDISALKKAAEECLVKEFGADKTKWPKKLKSPFRDQVEREKEVDGKMVLPPGHEAGAIFCTFKSITRPGVVDQNVEGFTDESLFYAGCVAWATVRPYYYDQKGNKGVALGLQNIQKYAEGTPLGAARAAASSEFAPVEGTNDTATNSNDSMWT